jgi:murein DD-endopeptidase MepM/ murein hydrolase activator NlpD
MKARAPLWRATAVFFVTLFGAVVALATIAPVREAELPLPQTATPLAVRADLSVLPSPASYVREERFRRGETLAEFLGRLEIAAADAERLRGLPAIRLIRPGTIVTAKVRADGELAELSFLAPGETLLTVTRDGAGLRATESPAPLVAWTTMKASVIRTSLFAAADTAGIPDGVSIQLADIFGGDIDFHRDLRKGDRFSVVFEQLMLDGSAVRAGRVLAAEFVNQGRIHRAVWFAPAGGKGGWYTPEGKNLRKAFLRSPLEFSRVSSGFGMRLHPFLREWRAHRGVDYAAPAGTRVRATGDGVVEFSGRNGGYGNVVVLRHAGQHSTLYAHLSGFARGIRRGTRVGQGETIGFVGQTGWATGPHLHYEFHVAGQTRNPLAIALPAALPVPARQMALFREQAQPLAARLDFLARSPIALFE